MVYSSSLVPAKWRWLYAINPLVGIIDGFRWCLLNTAPPDGMALLISMATVILTLLGGLMYFRHQEATFADII